MEHPLNGTCSLLERGHWRVPNIFLQIWNIWAASRYRGARRCQEVRSFRTGTKAGSLVQGVRAYSTGRTICTRTWNSSAASYRDSAARIAITRRRNPRIYVRMCDGSIMGTTWAWSTCRAIKRSRRRWKTRRTGISGKRFKKLDTRLTSFLFNTYFYHRVFPSVIVIELIL